MHKVGIIMGSDSDRDVMNQAKAILEEFEIPVEINVISAHRTPDRLVKYCEKAEQRGLAVIIAGAGGAAHLPGVTAAHTRLPVIGVPIKGSSLSGLDSLLSIVQMPKGIPVATVGIGPSGAINAALLAIEIISVGTVELRDKMSQYRKKMAEKCLAQEPSVDWDDSSL